VTEKWKWYVEWVFIFVDVYISLLEKKSSSSMIVKLHFKKIRSPFRNENPTVVNKMLWHLVEVINTCEIDFPTLKQGGAIVIWFLRSLIDFVDIQTHWLSFRVQNDDPFPSCSQCSSYHFDFVWMEFVVLKE